VGQPPPAGAYWLGCPMPCLLQMLLISEASAGLGSSADVRISVFGPTGLRGMPSRARTSRLVDSRSEETISQSNSSEDEPARSSAERER
jgi:hypothetical protein